MQTEFMSSLFYFDPLAATLITLVTFIGVTVANFAKRYLEGNARYYRFFGVLSALIFSTIMMGCADNLLFLLLTWGLSNLLLVNLMIFNPNWKIAKASGMLAIKNFGLGFFFVGSAFAIFYLQTGIYSLQLLVEKGHDGSFFMTMALVLLGLGAMTQSAIFPFHKWLISSLNSPTPVSAIMHAGLINGGGFLLTRFASLYIQAPILLNLLFIIGLVTALLGTLFKLIQSDVKRMLACSTMGQMGFMIVQCGLGLFPAAIAHLCWHGLFKAYLFLGSGSAAQENRVNIHYPPSLLSFFSALSCGIVGSYVFTISSTKTGFSMDTTLVLSAVALIGISHFVLPILRKNPFLRLPFALTAAVMIGGLYGLSVQLVESILTPMHSLYRLPLNYFHFAGVFVLFLVWVIFIFWQPPKANSFLRKMINQLYVKILNASQPHPTTVTTHRNQYEYL